MKFLKNEYLDTPHGNFSVWRYLAHWKFESLLKESALFFANASSLSDQYEVTIPNSVLISKRKQLEKAGFKKADLDEQIKLFHWQNNPLKDFVFTNCWSINPYESYALWKIYLGGEKNGVAIRSTVSSLRTSIEVIQDQCSEEFFIGKVKYRTHLKNDELQRLVLITTKKPFYEFERELRVFTVSNPISKVQVSTPGENQEGRLIAVNIQTLIHEIYISPFADANYLKKVQTLLTSYGLKKICIKNSEIRDT
jgi:hypothetical protein